MAYLIPVLLIDDDEDYVSLMKTILEDEGYSVDYAYNGHDGLAKVVPGKYAAVITDYVMPLLKGDEVAERIKKIDAEVGLILLTGYKHALPQEALERFSTVLEKPVSPGEVLTALRKVVGGMLTLIKVRQKS